MFTGIVVGTGVVRSIERRRSSRRVVIQSKTSLKGLKKGESIAVNGCCLTVVTHSPKSFTVDIAKESLAVTTLGNLKKGEVVNLERALQLSDRLGGHWVTGHIDTIGTLTKKAPFPEGELWTIRYPKKFQKYLVLKGSITVEGVSLTLNRVGPTTFEIFLIPHTLAETNFVHREVKDRLNLEVDILGKYIESLLKHRK